QRDATTGLDYLRARYLNPATGRFVSRDTFSGSILVPLSENPFLYTHGNPINHRDPSGHLLLEALVAPAVVFIGLQTLTHATRSRYSILYPIRVLELIGEVSKNDKFAFYAHDPQWWGYGDNAGWARNNELLLTRRNPQVPVSQGGIEEYVCYGIAGL